MPGLRILLALSLAGFWPATTLAGAPADPAALAQLDAGQAVELIVEYSFADVEAQSELRRRSHPGRISDDANLRSKADAYRSRKSRVREAAADPDRDDLRDYSHLPLSFHRFRSRKALEKLLAQPEVRAAYPNTAHATKTAQSLPLIGQTATASAGVTGGGTTVAVIDTAIEIANPAFGGCTAPGQPASCRIVARQMFGSGSTTASHGTNVAAIVAAVAPGAKIAALDVFSGSSAFSADIFEAINWSIANRSAYNIVALNMSLGDGVRHKTSCGPGTAYYQAVSNALAAGIAVVAASGNEGFADGLGSPACTVGVTSVGAVYDANVGGITWGGGLCTDTSSAADRITCFSNSANFLTLLAPGALISAGGYTMGGTSQASPHVAGALAVLAAEYPGESTGQRINRLIATGQAISDARNGLVKPRLNLLASAHPANDAFAGRFALTGSTGTVAGSNMLASREAGEPAHAGNGGGRSLWWTITPTTSGQLAVDTVGSDFDTLLAAYSGSAVNALSLLAANDNAGGGISEFLLQVVAGVPLSIAVDGFDGAGGELVLHWNLNASAAADIGVELSGPAFMVPGSSSTWQMTIRNLGPQPATNARAVLALPPNVGVVQLPDACSASTSAVDCVMPTVRAGESVAFPIQLAWAAGSAGGILRASAGSDLPDSTPANNSATLLVSMATPATGDSADVPLPLWALLLLGALLSRQIVTSSKH